MKIDPIIPLPIMIIICAVLIIFTRKGVWNYVRKGILVVLLFAVNLRILIPGGDLASMQNNVDILFVVDNTISMLAEDYNGDGRRIDGVRADLDKIMDGFPGARYGMVSFAETPYYMVPFTYDSDLIRQAAGTLEGQSKVYANGTSLNVAYDAMKSSLKSNADDDKDEDETGNEDRITLVFLISDGEITSRARLKDFSKIAEYIDGGAVLGYGTRSGGTMRVRYYASSEDAEELYYYDSHYNRVVAVSKIDEDNLEQIAEDMGVPYYHLTKPRDTDNMIDELNEKIENGEFTKGDSDEKGYSETYWWFAGALAVFLLYEFIRVRIRMAKER